MQFVNPSFMSPTTGMNRSPTNFLDSEFSLNRLQEPVLGDANDVKFYHGQLIASRITPGQEKDLQFILSIAVDPKPSATNLKIAKDFMANWKPPKADLESLKQNAEKVVKNYFDKPGSRAVEFAKNWTSYSPSEKAGTVHDFVQSMNAALGTSFNVNIINTPPVNGAAQRGFYNPPTNTITLNLNDKVSDSFGSVISTAFHEAVHGIYFNKTKGMTPDVVLTNVKNGKLSYTDGVAYANLSQNLYIDGMQDFNRYSTQPHEELAFSGQIFFDRGLSSRGITVRPALNPGHSTLVNIQRHKL